MLSLFLTNILICFTHSQLTKDAYYTNWFGKLSSSTTIETTNRIIDIILPGSHHAGMYKSAIVENGYLEADDDYYNDILAYQPGGDAAHLAWSKRQIGTIKDQLDAGSRFLDIRLEKHVPSGEIYAHHGLLGANLTVMLDDINAYLTGNPLSKEIIILSFNNFINIDADTDVFNTAFDTTLSSFMKATSQYDIAADKIDTLGINIIPFFDGDSSNPFIWDNSSLRLTGDEIISSEDNEIISGTLSQLVNAWDSSTTTGQLNQIYYALNIPGTSGLTKYENTFPSYLEYNANFVVTLPNTINNYPKLYFGNIIIVDFIEASPVVDQVVILNYNYLSCRDDVTNWNDIMDCSQLTDLSRDYKSSDISTSCTGVGSTFQTSCKRSCGTCTWLTGVPGSECSNGVCTSDIYTDTLNGNGVCFTRPADSETFIAESTFCLAPFANDNCGTISSDVCSSDVQSDNACTEFCNANFQCLSGYCNTAMGVCLEITTPAPTEAVKPSECYCPHVISEQAVDFRDDIAGFRPGDPDGKYAFVGGACSSPGECNEMLDENPYIKSLVGFIVIPFIFAIIMFIMYFCCCLCWCTCGNFWKKKCCRCCLGEPEESIGARWGPTITMFAILIVILWACIEGITANQKMHDHVFSATEDSLRREMLGLFDVVIDKFEGLGPEADWIVNNIKDVFGSVDTIVNNVDDNTAQDISTIYKVFKYLSMTYNDYALNATVTTPFEYNNSLANYSVYLPCDYCGGLGMQISDINDTFKQAVSVIQNMKSMVNGSMGIVDAEEMIDEAVGEFKKVIENFTNTIEIYRANTTTYLDEFETYDEQREQAGTYFFILPILWIVLWLIGVIFGILNKCNRLCEWCFRCTWCQSMFIGATIMLIFSFFSIISVGWADFCVNLDQFEADPVGSRLGQTIASVSGNSSGGGLNPVDIVNACWTGSDLLGVFNLTDTLDWTSFRENLTDAMNVDIGKEFSFSQLDEFITEINLLNIDEFQVQGDILIDKLNNVGIGQYNQNTGYGCICTCGSIHGTDADAIFTRDKLRNNQCHNTTSNAPWDCWGYSQDVVTNEWDPTALINDPSGPVKFLTACSANYTAAYTYVQAEIQLTVATNKVIDDIKNQTAQIIAAYSSFFGTVVDIQNSVKNISCSINPIFDRFDIIIKNYSNCGFLGDAYGGFKNVGCVLLFTDMYWISCAMMIIAFFSILIVCMGFMTQYSWHPAKDSDPDEDIGSKLVKRASQKLVTTPLGRQLSARASDKFPRISNSLKDLQLSVNMANDEMLHEGNGDNDEGDNEQQPPPPNDAPPQETNQFETINDGDGMGTTNDGIGGNTGDTQVMGGDLEMPQMEASAPVDVQDDFQDDFQDDIQDDVQDDVQDDSMGGDVL